jgi:hypothetical protein
MILPRGYLGMEIRITWSIDSLFSIAVLKFKPDRISQLSILRVMIDHALYH